VLETVKQSFSCGIFEYCSRARPHLKPKEKKAIKLNISNTC